MHLDVRQKSQYVVFNLVLFCLFIDDGIVNFEDSSIVKQPVMKPNGACEYHISIEPFSCDYFILS